MAPPDLTRNKQILRLMQIIKNKDDVILELETEIQIKDKRIHELSEKLVLAYLEEKIHHGKRK